jgi:hypothetical protein
LVSLCPVMVATSTGFNPFSNSLIGIKLSYGTRAKYCTETAIARRMRR